MLVAGTVLGEWSHLAFSDADDDRADVSDARSARSSRSRRIPTRFGIWTSRSSRSTRYVNPVIAVALGTLVLGEPFHVRMLVAAAIIVVGILIVGPSQDRRLATGSPDVGGACQGPGHDARRCARRDRRSDGGRTGRRPARCASADARRSRHAAASPPAQPSAFSAHGPSCSSAAPAAGLGVHEARPRRLRRRIRRASVGQADPLRADSVLRDRPRSGHAAGRSS